MSKCLSKVAVVALICFSSALTGRAQASPSMVSLPDTPLKLVSTTGTATDFLSSVTVRNVSNRRVKSFQLGIIMAVPAACGPNEFFAPEQVFRTDWVGLNPGDLAQTSDYLFSPKTVSNFAKDHFSNVVNTQIAVVRVDFVDGSSWTFSRTGKIYDSDLYQKDAQLRCLKVKPAELLAKASCAKLKRVGNDPGGAFYTCGSGSGQICQNSNNGSSCTNSICSSADTCPDQSCTYNSGSPVPVKPAPTLLQR